MTYPIIIDQAKCIGCGSCVKDCPANCFEVRDGLAVYAHDACFACGHCYAICPVDAIDMTDYDTSHIGDFASMADFDSDKLLLAMKFRRSVRFFKKQAIEPEKVHMILEAGRYTPTAKNNQGLKFTILGSKQDEIEEVCVKLFGKATSLGGVFNKNIARTEIDDDFFFKGAPLVIVVSGTNGMDKGLATSYMEIMAESLGLGVLISGFTETLINKYPKVKKLAAIPAGYEALGVLVIGYPDVSYKRIPPRKDIDLEIL